MNIWCLQEEDVIFKHMSRDALKAFTEDTGERHNITTLEHGPGLDAAQVFKEADEQTASQPWPERL